MAGINNGQPEATIGEPIRFGNDLDYEIEQHPISDRLLIRDTANEKVAYIRADRGGEIGGDGVLIKALKESKPMNDTGRVYDTIQEAERKASSWVFVPPGTYNESVEINTEGLTLQGCGYNTLINGGSFISIITNSKNINIKNLSVKTTSGGGNNADGINTDTESSELTIENVTVRDTDRHGIIVNQGSDNVIVNCTVESSDNTGIQTNNVDGSIVSHNNISNSENGIAVYATNCIVSNNIVKTSSVDNIQYGSSTSGDSIIIGNRCLIADRHNIRLFNTSNNIVANNRVSDAVSDDLSDDGTGTLLAGNLTGASN